jgi:CRP-like cAMP-binding protein
VAFILQVVSGVGMVVVDVLGITALQRRVANEQLGRVLGAFQATITAAVVAASFIVSAVISSAGVVAGLLVTGLAVPALGASLFRLLVRADRLSAATAEQLRGRVSLLERLDLFEGTASAVLERLAAAAEPVSLPARSVVIREGDPADALWILVEGSLSVRATGGPAGSQQLPTVNAPSYVGELGLVHGVPRTATVRTREPSELLRIDGDTFLDALNSAPPSGSMVKLSGDRWQRTARRRNLDGSAVQRAASAIGFAGGSTEPAQQAGDRR